MTLSESDRAYVLGRLDRAHIDEVAKAVRFCLNTEQAAEANYQPGDGTYYALVFARPMLCGGSGGGTASFPATSYIGSGRTFVAYLQRDTTSDFGAYDDPEWVASELTDNEASALAIAELLRAVVQEGAI